MPFYLGLLGLKSPLFCDILGPSILQIGHSLLFLGIIPGVLFNDPVKFERLLSESKEST